MPLTNGTSWSHACGSWGTVRPRSSRRASPTRAARLLSDVEGQPKYLNTPQTPLFDKGSILYGIDLARHAIRESGTAVIVEGYMDAIAAHQFGYENVVAAMGTALTEQQVGLVRRGAKRIVMALDADAAGQMATLRGLETMTVARR